MSAPLDGNPFASPDVDDAPPPQADLGFEVEGRRLWVPKAKPWPRWCVRCGERAVAAASTSVIHQPMLGLTRREPVELPLCRRHARRRRIKNVAIALGVLAFPASFALEVGGGGIILAGFLALLSAAVLSTIGGLRSRTYRDGRYLVTGVGAAYRERIAATVGSGVDPDSGYDG